MSLETILFSLGAGLVRQLPYFVVAGVGLVMAYSRRWVLAGSFRALVTGLWLLIAASSLSVVLPVWVNVTRMNGLLGSQDFGLRLAIVSWIVLAVHVSAIVFLVRAAFLGRGDVAHA